MWLKIFGGVIVLVGLLIIFDSRRLVRKNFNFGEENTAVLGLKILGFLMLLIGGIMMIAGN